MVAYAQNDNFHIGDYYEKEGIKGIIVRIDDSGEHGLVMSLKECSKKWIDNNDENIPACAYDKTDGEKNMEAVAQWLKENGKTWSIFPFFQWCRNLGTGWYAPALDELKDILFAINGNEDKLNKKQLKLINKQLKKHGGDLLLHEHSSVTNEPYSMFSSTESESAYIYTLEYISAYTTKVAKTFKILSTIALATGSDIRPSADGHFEIKQKLKSINKSNGSINYGSRAVHKF